eukprot:11175882-Lingulodinium_polyedra.AAC.1
MIEGRALVALSHCWASCPVSHHGQGDDARVSRHGRGCTPDPANGSGLLMHALVALLEILEELE